MKKIISLLVIALLGITTSLSINAMGSFFSKEKLIINGKEIASGYMVIVYGIGDDNSIYYDVRSDNNGTTISNYYQYNNGNIKNINEDKLDLSIKKRPEVNYISGKYQKNTNISKHYKVELNEETSYKSIYIDGKLEGSFESSYNVEELGDNAVYYMLINDKGEALHKIYLISDDKIQETPKTTQANPKLDKILLSFFEKIDTKGDEIAQKTYKKLVEKIDILLKTKLSEKNENTLNYIKEKVQEKIK